MAIPTERLPTGPTEADLAKKDRFRRNLKIIFIAFCLITTVFLAIGIYLAVDPGRNIKYVLIPEMLFFLPKLLIIFNGSCL